MGATHSFPKQLVMSGAKGTETVFGTLKQWRAKMADADSYMQARMRAIMDRMVTDAMLACTSNVAPAPQEPMTLAKLSATIAAMKAPAPKPNAGKIVESVEMVDRFEDWSKARSPSRTRRRMKYNAHRIYSYKPKTYALQMPDGSLVMHPVMADALRKATR